MATWFDDQEIVCLRIGKLDALLRVGPIDDLEIETDGFAKDKAVGFHAGDIAQGESAGERANTRGARRAGMPGVG